MASFDELRQRWEQRRTEGEQLGALVPLEKIASQVLAELGELAHADADMLTIAEAAALSGYSEDHLRRQIADGRIPNAGRRNKPAILRSDVPRKPGHVVPLPAAGSGGSLSPRRRIVLEATTPPRSA